MNRILLMVLRNWWRVPYLFAKLCRYAKHTDRYPESKKWSLIQHIMQLAVQSGNVDLQVHGQEHIPAPGTGFVMYPNHQGIFDVVAIAATCDTPLGAVLKKELTNVPLIKQIRQCTKSFPMDREDVRQSLEVIRNVTTEVGKGRGYVIFPEGTRSKNGNTMGAFHSGSFRAAVKAKCPIIPVALINSFQVLDQKGCKPLTVQLHYLQPIPYEQYAHLKTTEIAELVRKRILQTIDANL